MESHHDVNEPPFGSIEMSVRARMMALVGLFLVLLLAIGSWGVVSTTSLQNRMMAQHNALSEAELAVVMAEVSVRRQLGHCKSLLLRGHKEEVLRGHWEEFLREEAAAREKMEEALALLPTGSVSAGLAMKFLRDHEAFGVEHREALQVFQVGDERAQARSDRLVEGQVEQLLAPIGELTRVLKAERAHLEPSLREHSLRRSISTMVAVVITSLTAFVVMAVAMHQWMNLSILSAGRKKEEPKAAADEAPVRSPATPAAVTKSWRRVLIAEEDPEARRALAKDMADWNCEVLVAGSGSELVRHLDLDGHSPLRTPPDLVVVSDSLPGVAPQTLLRWLKAEPSTREIPFVLREANGRKVEDADLELLAAVVPKSMAAGDWQKRVMKILKDPPESVEASGGWDVSEAFSRLRETTILAAEDEPLNRKYLGLMLKKVGSDHALVADGREAVEAVEEREFDVILMDCGLPVVDGYTATRQIRSSSTMTESPPVVIGVTAHTDEEVRQKCLEAGMDACVPKPLKLEYLCLVIEEELAKREERNLQRAGEGVAGRTS